MIEVRILSFLCSFALFFYCIINTYSDCFDCIALAAPLREEEFFKIRVFNSDMLKNSPLKLSFPEK